LVCGASLEIQRAARGNRPEPRGGRGVTDRLNPFPPKLIKPKTRN
jgi:hypothetical protein